MKVEETVSASGSGSGSISQRHGSADPDPHQNVMDPQHSFYHLALYRDAAVQVTLERYGARQQA